MVSVWWMEEMVELLVVDGWIGPGLRQGNAGAGPGAEIGLD